MKTFTLLVFLYGLQAFSSPFSPPPLGSNPTSTSALNTREHENDNDNENGNGNTSSTAHTSGGAEHIVLLHANESFTNPHDHSSSILSALSLSPSHPDVRLIYNNSAFHGFAASMNSHCLDALATMADVSHVEKSVSIASVGTIRHDQPMNWESKQKYQDTRRAGEKKRRDSSATRPSSPWGLQRISSLSPITGDAKAMDYTYTFTPSTSPSLQSPPLQNPQSQPQSLQSQAQAQAPGAGVDIYIVDTGIYTPHTIFNGRATSGFSFETDVSDGDGHGTHVAGTAAGSIFGVASSAHLISVKVLGADGSGSSADTIAGMDYVLRTHDSKHSPENGDFVGSIMSMSWGLDGPSPAVTKAIQAASAAGIHVSLAAGNSGKDACTFSPSNSGGVNSDSIVTVGSIGPSDAISSFSNTGSCVDIYAPGENVLSAWKDGPTTVNYLSGTSMACPHVTGVMASLMSADKSLGFDPVALKKKLLGLAQTGVTGNSGVQKAVMVNNGFTASTGRRSLAEALTGWVRIGRRALEGWNVVDEDSHVH